MVSYDWLLLLLQRCCCVSGAYVLPLSQDKVCVSLSVFHRADRRPADICVELIFMFGSLLWHRLIGKRPGAHDRL